MDLLKNNGLSDSQWHDSRRIIHPCKSHGKTPLTPNGCKDASNDLQVIEAWKAQYPNCNWGLATGSISGVFVLDVDINHAQGKYGDLSLDELEAQHGKLPETATVLTGGGGKHFYFKMPEGVEIPCSAGKLGANLDLRSTGGYVIIPPSVHENGRTYEWESDFDPYEDGMLFADAPTWLINLVKRDTRAVLVHSGQGYYESSEWDCMADSQQADFKDALTVIDADDRDTWVAVGMAIHSMDSGETGFNLWTGYSQKSLKFDAKDQARVWFSFKNKENKRNKETVFYMARELNWESETKLQEIAQKEAMGNAITDAINNPLRHDPDDYVDPFIKIDHTFPTDCNLLNQISGIINASSSCVTQAATTQATLALASLMASRKYLTPYNSPCHLYLGVCSAPDGDTSELRETTRLINEILSECGLSNMIRNSRITSTQVLYKMLVQSPASLYVCDDIANMITTSGRQNSAGGLDVVLNTITGIYSVDSVQLDSHADVGMRKDELDSFRNVGDQDDRPLIKHPSLSMLALLSDDDLPVFSRTKEASRGSTPQYLLAICDADDFKLKEKSKLVLTEEVIEGLYRVRGFTRKDGKLNKTLKDIFDDLSGLIPHMTDVEFEDSIDEYDKMIDSVITDSRYQRKYRTWARENMRRLMTILAAFNPTVSVVSGKPIATKPIMRWCAQYVAGHLQRVLDKLKVVASDDGKMEVGQKIEAVLLNKKAQGLKRCHLVNYCRPYERLSKEKRDEIIDRLVDDGLIKLDVEVIDKKTGHKEKHIVHSRFVKQTNFS
jgi:hypothetical protein